MYAIALLLLWSQGYFLVVHQSQLIETHNGYDLRVHFRNNGNQNATCEAHVGDQYESFAIAAFGRDDETFQDVDQLASVALSCEVTH